MIPMWRDLVEGNIYVGKYLQAKIGINIDDQTYCGTLKKISMVLKIFHLISYLFSFLTKTDVCAHIHTHTRTGSLMLQFLSMCVLV